MRSKFSKLLLLFILHCLQKPNSGLHHNSLRILCIVLLGEFQKPVEVREDECAFKKLTASSAILVFFWDDNSSLLLQKFDKCGKLNSWLNDASVPEFHVYLLQFGKLLLFKTWLQHISGLILKIAEESENWCVDFFSIWENTQLFHEVC